MATKHQQSTIPDYIDEAAKSAPNDTWAIVPQSSIGLEEGWRYLTYAHLAKAVDCMAWWIEKTVGVASQPGKTIGYMGANDLQYLVVLAAVLKAGYVPMFTSPRNSLDGQKSLVEKTNCDVFMTTAETTTQVAAIQEAIPHLKVFQVPEAAEVLELNTSLAHFESRQDRNIAAHSLILHTSGSTGLPKPIYLTVGGLKTVHAQASLAPEDGCGQASEAFLAGGKPMLAAVPFFHAMGIIVGLRSIMCRGPIVRLPSHKMLSADLIIDVIEDIRPTSGIFPPSILEDLSTTDKGLEALAKLDMVFFGGAPLATTSGDRICRVTQLVTIIGSTEAFLLCTLLPGESDEWKYFHWAAAAGTVMEPAGDDLFELVLKPKDEEFQAIFHTFPDIREWRTKDLFQQHPSKHYLWKYTGRRDDIVVLSNGEKFNPVVTEKLIESDRLVKGALVVGQGKFQAGLLIEPEWSQISSSDPAALIDRIWPIVEEANREAPAHARIYQSKIAITNKEKPFVRAAKGSIIRLQTMAAFKDEIEALYSDEGYSSDLDEGSNHDSELISKVRAILTRCLPQFEQDTLDTIDIFTLGVDSLDVLALTNALNKAISGVKITAPIIYSNPSVQQIVQVLSQNGNLAHGEPDAALTREEQMDRMVRKYTKDMVRKRGSKGMPERPSKRTVVITGTTGSLGTHMLAQILKDPTVEKVYCMNRSANAKERQEESFSRYHSGSIDLRKAEFLRTDFSRDKFGLSDETYTQLLSTVTGFIHSAWSVDFNLSLESYETTHISGTRRVVDFSAACVYRPSIVFISSIASVGNWGSITDDSDAVPETVSSLFDNAMTLPQGYGESKHVASQILAIASHRLGINTAIIRAGQLAGPSADAEGSAWNRHEWLPTLVHTSKILKKLPRTLGNQDRVDWVPMDIAAGTVLDIAAHRTSELAEVYHLINPHTTSWSDLYPVIRNFYHDSGIDLEVLEYNEWVEALKQIPRTKENAEQVPGLKLLEFYESLRPGTGLGLPALETSKAEEASRTLKEGSAVDEKVIRRWLEQWAF